MTENIVFFIRTPPATHNDKIDLQDFAQVHPGHFISYPVILSLV